MNILVTGGLGYIGSHFIKELLSYNDEHTIIIVDNLSTGNMYAYNELNKIKAITLYKNNLNELTKIDEILKKHNIEAIIHFAASIVVPESIQNPFKYFSNNTINTINLINLAIENNVGKFIFSSTAATYGEHEHSQLSEIDIQKPINPYGNSKLLSEIALKDLSKNKMKFIIFRYFNVAGADMFYNKTILEPRIGQMFPNATHLIKVASECVTNKREFINIFGNKFNTPDGTGIRDYIHVDDLVRAHILGLDYLENNSSNIFNVGYGNGFSVLEVIEAMEYVSNKKIKYNFVEAREGDPANLISNNEKILKELKWKPIYNNIELICESAYKWELFLKKLNK